MGRKVTLLTNVFSINTQLTFTCLKPTLETLEKGVKYVQSNNKNTKTPFSSVSVVDFEQVNPFLTICLKDTCTEGSKLAVVEWFYSSLTLLLTSNRHSLAQTQPNNLKAIIFGALP